MARQWRDIALIMRDRQYSENEDLEIDIFDVQVNLALTVRLTRWLTD